MKSYGTCRLLGFCLRRTGKWNQSCSKTCLSTWKYKKKYNKKILNILLDIFIPAGHVVEPAVARIRVVPEEVQVISVRRRSAHISRTLRNVEISWSGESNEAICFTFVMRNMQWNESQKSMAAFFYLPCLMKTAGSFPVQSQDFPLLELEPSKKHFLFLILLVCKQSNIDRFHKFKRQWFL